MNFLTSQICFMNLADYLKKHSLTHRGFGEKVGVQQSHITNILSGRKSPSLRLMRRIIEVTNGGVTVGDLYNPKAPSRLKVNDENT